MRVVGINIGSNLGDREANLRHAVDEIGRLTGSRLRVSGIYESESWGYQSDNPFYNVAAEFESDLPCDRLLEIFQTIERAAGSTVHRDASGGYADRTLDIDLIYSGDEQIATPTLTVPHPRLAERRFVLQPLSELSPGWRHPATGLSVAEMLSELEK